METGKIIVDFQVTDCLNPKKFSVVDQSRWQHIKDKPTIIEVTLPGFANPVTNYFQQCAVNTFDSFNLDLTCITDGCEPECVDLPDGIYTITVKGSPDTYQETKKYLRTTSLQLTLDKLFVENLYNDELKVKKQKVEVLIRMAEANVRYDNFCKANELYEEANKLAEKIKDCV